MMLRTLFAVLFVIASAVAAMAQDWALERVSGEVLISTDGQTWNPASAGTVLENGSWVRTGPRSRVILARGTDRMIYRADTLAAVSTSVPSGQMTRVTQQRGSIFVSVETRQRKHTSVVTPHLAAVVKGTVFEVSTDSAASTVRVDQGLVEVSDDSGRAEVSDGRQATSSGRSLAISEARVTSRIPGTPNAFGLELRPINANPNRNADPFGTGLPIGNAVQNGRPDASGTGNRNIGRNEADRGNENRGGSGNEGRDRRRDDDRNGRGN